jgi:hypothetical protein
MNVAPFSSCSAAVPPVANLVYLQANPGRESRHSLDLVSPSCGERSLRVLSFALGLAVRKSSLLFFGDELV